MNVTNENRMLKTFLFFVSFKLNEISGLMSRVFANGPVDRGSIPGRVIPKTKKNGT